MKKLMEKLIMDYLDLNENESIEYQCFVSAETEVDRGYYGNSEYYETKVQEPYYDVYIKSTKETKYITVSQVLAFMYSKILENGKQNP